MRYGAAATAAALVLPVMVLLLLQLLRLLASSAAALKPILNSQVMWHSKQGDLTSIEVVATDYDPDTGYANAGLQDNGNLIFWPDGTTYADKYSDGGMNFVESDVNGSANFFTSSIIGYQTTQVDATCEETQSMAFCFAFATVPVVARFPYEDPVRPLPVQMTVDFNLKDIGELKPDGLARLVFNRSTSRFDFDFRMAIPSDKAMMPYKGMTYSQRYPVTEGGTVSEDGQSFSEMTWCAAISTHAQ